MKGDINNNLNKEGSLSKIRKTELAKNESREKTKTDSAKLAAVVSEIEVKDFKRVDKQGDLFSDFFSDFKK